MPSRAGSPNKPKRQLLALLQEKYPGYHPVLEMAKIANDMKNPVELRASMHRDVATYVTPKLKAIDHTFAGQGTLSVEINIVPHDEGQS